MKNMRKVEVIIKQFTLKYFTVLTRNSKVASSSVMKRVAGWSFNNGKFRIETLIESIKILLGMQKQSTYG